MNPELLIDDREFLVPIYGPVQKFDESQHRRDAKGKFIDKAFITVGDRQIEVVKPLRAIRAGDKLVPLNVVAFDAAFQREAGFYLGVGGGPNAIHDRYPAFGEFIAEHDSMEASEVTVNEDGKVGFTNGRHRYAWLRDQGLTSIPVSMDPESVRNAKKHGYLAAVKLAWDESEHPRNEEGKFTPKKMVALFKEKFRPVDDYGSTKFILPDGTRLMHMHDTHAAAAHAAGVDLDDVMRAGIIRYTPGTGAETGAPITKAQAQHLVDATVQSGGNNPLFVDVFRGRERFAKVFDSDRATAATVRNWVNSHFTDEAQKWDESQHPRDMHGRFSDVPAEPGTTPIPPGKIRGYHYTGDMDAVEQEGLNVSKAQGAGYGEPNAIWFSTAKPSNYKEYVEVFLDPSDIAMGAGPLRAREDPTSPEALAKIEDYNKGDHDFMVYSKGIPPDRFVSTHRPWHDHYRYFEENPESAKAVLAGEFDDLLDDPDHGPAIRKFKETHAQKFDPNEPRDAKGKWVEGAGTPGQRFAGRASDPKNIVGRLLDRASGLNKRPHEDYQPVTLTDVPDHTRFLLPDGTRLAAGVRGMEHADVIFEALVTDEPGAARKTPRLHDLQVAGVVRYSAGQYGGVELAAPLTKAQAQIIADDWNISYQAHQVRMDMDSPDPNNYTLGDSVQFQTPVTADQLVNWSRRAFQKVNVQKSEHSYGNTQIQIDPASSAAASLNAARATIADADCMADGKDVDPNHVTVRYGLENDDLDGLLAYLSTLAPFEARVLRVELFPASEHSDGAVPVVALIASPELRQIEKEIGKHADFKEKSFPVYKPHCTLAYVKPERAEPYGDLYVDGSFVVSAITISHKDDRQEVVHFGTQKFDPSQRRDAKGRWVDEGEDPPAVGPRIGFVAGDGKEHVGRKTGGLGNYAEDHTNTARRLLKDDQALNTIRTMLEQGAIRYWVRRGEVALNFKAGNPKTITHALKFLHDNYQHGDRIYLDVEHGDTTVGKFFDNLGEANRAIRQHGLVQKKDPQSGRYVTPFVSFDKQGDESLRMIASLNSSRLATWGFTAEAEVLGMARYRLTAVLDGRTSKFCRLIDGKIFNVPDARRKVIEVLEVQDPNDLKVVQPWPKQTKAAMAQWAQMSSAELTERGLHIPPYHPHCRTICRAIQTSAGESTEIVPTVPGEAEAFHAVTADDLKELGIDATPEQVDQWNEHVGMTPVELLSKLSGLPPQEVMTKGQGVGANPIRFEDNGSIGFNVRGSSPQGLEFKLGAILDPFTGTYYLTRADLEAGNPKAEVSFMKQMFSALIEMGLKSTATEVAVGVAGNAAYYARLGFLPDELEWEELRTHALSIADPLLASLQPEDRLLVEHLLQDHSVSAMSALVELPFIYEGKTIGEYLFGEATGTWGLDLTDDLLVAQARGYLA